MRRIVNQFKISKFKRITEGLIFAVISCISIILCLLYISNSKATNMEIFVPFIIALISLLLGFVTMFRDYSY